MKRAVVFSTAACFVLALCFALLPASASDAKKITFNKDVAPVFFKNCAECHRAGEAAPFSILSYKDARPWARSIKEKVISRQMPPWHADPHYGQFTNDRRLSQKEIDTIVAWVDQGAAEGDPRDLPPAPQFAEGWAIGKPDMIIEMPNEYTLEAAGPDEIQYFEVPTSFKEDVYVQMAEARPGNRKIVHHIIAFVQPPPKGDQPKLTKEEIEKYREQIMRDSIFYQDGTLTRTKADAPVYDDGCALASGGSGFKRDGSGQDEFNLGTLLCGFAPGMNPAVWETGTVKKIPTGSKLILQIHYSKVAGRVEKDRSMVGLKLAKVTEKQLLTRPVSNNYFLIPPGAERHKVTACWKVEDDIHLVSLMPHMHYRGAAMEIAAVYADGKSEILLNVPRYSFSWQTVYYLKNPVAIPKGTRIVVTAHYDNSARNKFNPDPTKAVRFGDPTYDDMMIGWIDYTVDSHQIKPLPASGKAARK
jgi:mono/diheme cytochrome c family protein